MKRLILLFVALTLVTYTFAQVTLTERNFSIGPRVGVNWTKLTNTDNADYNTGIVAGLTSTYSILESAGLSLDALYSREGTSFTNATSQSTALDYLRFVLTFDYFFNDLADNFRPKIYVGPQLGVLLAANNQVEGADDVDVKDAYNTLDLGLALGLGFNVRVGTASWLNVDGRYIPGLTNIISDKPSGADAIHNQNFQLSVGLAFGL